MVRVHAAVHAVPCTYVQPALGAAMIHARGTYYYEAIAEGSLFPDPLKVFQSAL